MKECGGGGLTDNYSEQRSPDVHLLLHSIIMRLGLILRLMRLSMKLRLRRLRLS